MELEKDARWRHLWTTPNTLVMTKLEYEWAWTHWRAFKRGLQRGNCNALQHLGAVLSLTAIAYIDDAVPIKMEYFSYPQLFITMCSVPCAKFFIALCIPVTFVISLYSPGQVNSILRNGREMWAKYSKLRPNPTNHVWENSFWWGN